MKSSLKKKMTKQKKYKRVVDKLSVTINKAEQTYRRTGAKRDKEYLDYLKLRRSRYIL